MPFIHLPEALHQVLGPVDVARAEVAELSSVKDPHQHPSSEYLTTGEKGDLWCAAPWYAYRLVSVSTQQMWKRQRQQAQKGGIQPP